MTLNELCRTNKNLPMREFLRLSQSWEPCRDYCPAVDRIPSVFVDKPVGNNCGGCGMELDTPFARAEHERVCSHVIRANYDATRRT